MKKAKKIAALITVLVMLFTAVEMCPVVSAASATKTVNVSKNYTVNGTVCLKYSAKYSLLKSKSKAAKKVNKKIKSIVKKHLTTMKKDAEEVFASPNVYIHAYVLNINIKMTSNKNGKYSFKSAIYTDMSGAHGCTNVTGLNFSKKTGKKIANSKLTRYSNSTLKKKIVKKIEKEIEKNPSKYYAEALDTVKSTSINKFVFFIKGSNLHVYFNHYILSPYMAGPTEIAIKL